uniref:Uncharacterized protein n=1 Tax=Panagrolaimus davidi TaxID=227884 RepID=A0A914PP09_9BILA
MMICLFLLLLFASSVNLQTITLPLPINGQIRGNYYGINDTVYIASGDNMLPQNLKDSFRFDEQKNLVVKTTSTQSLDFIIVYQNALDPIFEWCRSPEYKLCEDELIVCFDHSCSDASMFSLRYELHPVFNHIGDKSVTGACVHVHSSGLKIDQGEFVSSPVQINAQAFAQDVSLTQTFVHILGSTCGAILRFPKASLAFTESLSSPSTTTTAAERLSNSSVESSNGIFSTTPASHESNTWQLIAVIGGSIFGVILILGLIALVVYLCLRKKTSKKPTSKTGMKIVKLRATKSMESVANVVPSSPPKAAQPDPSKVTKPLPPTSKPVESKVPKTQPPKVLPIQPMLKTESTQSSGESVATAIVRREKCGVFFPREFSDDPTKTAEERTKEPSGDLSLIQTAFPRMDIDSSKPYSKLFEADFKVDLVQEISAPRQPKLIIPLLTQRIVDESVPESEYTPDCLVQQAFRLPLVEDRAAMLLQAT